MGIGEGTFAWRSEFDERDGVAAQGGVDRRLRLSHIR